MLPSRVDLHVRSWLDDCTDTFRYVNDIPRLTPSIWGARVKSSGSCCLEAARCGCGRERIFTWAQPAKPEAEVRALAALGGVRQQEPVTRRLPCGGRCTSGQLCEPAAGQLLGASGT
mmetsp:Transcript_71319/g.164915  ORF Transcript_71319/g.164915 Transcript_71319/m.164915 type:complete len:117 (+) Transcript_71319:149-499(+)